MSGDSARSERVPAAVETPRRAARRFPLSNELFALQRRLTGSLAGAFNGIKERARLTHVVVLLLVAFAYGAVHSLGPGHAKSLFVSYTLARPTTAAETWAAGGLFALTHTGMALVSFTILRQLLHQEQGRIEEYSRSMLRASGGLVVLAGVIVLIAPLLEGMAEAAVRRSLSKINKMGFLAVVAGLAPCPGAFLILVFSSVAGLLHIGIMAVVAVSLGMAITVSAFAHTGVGWVRLFARGCRIGGGSGRGVWFAVSVGRVSLFLVW